MAAATITPTSPALRSISVHCHQERQRSQLHQPGPLKLKLNVEAAYKTKTKTKKLAHCRRGLPEMEATTLTDFGLDSLSLRERESFPFVSFERGSLCDGAVYLDAIARWPIKCHYHSLDLTFIIFPLQRPMEQTPARIFQTHNNGGGQVGVPICCLQHTNNYNVRA